jgi:hypothetical protein
MRSYELNYIDLKVNKHNPQCQNIAEMINAFLEEWLWFTQDKLRRLVRRMNMQERERGGFALYWVNVHDNAP